MSKGMLLFLSVLAAGMAQFAILASVVGTTPLAIAAGTIGTMGAALGGLLTNLPKDKWTDEERDAKLNGKSDSTK